MVWGLNCGRDKRFLFSKVFKPEAHPAFYAWGTQGAFAGGKGSGA